MEELDKTSAHPNSIAHTLYSIYGHAIRYSGKNKWLFIDDKGVWKDDIDRKALTAHMIMLSTQFTERALHWSGVVEKTSHSDHEQLEQAVCTRDRLLTIATKLKTIEGRKQIAKEAREYFVVD